MMTCGENVACGENVRSPSESSSSVKVTCGENVSSCSSSSSTSSMLNGLPTASVLASWPCLRRVETKPPKRIRPKSSFAFKVMPSAASSICSTQSNRSSKHDLSSCIRSRILSTCAATPKPTTEFDGEICGEPAGETPVEEDNLKGVPLCGVCRDVNLDGEAAIADAGASERFVLTVWRPVMPRFNAVGSLKSAFCLPAFRSLKAPLSAFNLNLSPTSARL
mmetsp:Transcript_55993/g.102689  ORF Transcript_55993/g.102689 Transcript_55993/m.102689 type:complete len:221 (+) Transcript_55993:360-1022(+)